MTSDTAVFSRLSRRMRALEQLVSPCNVLADVGCDHGFLAICFVQTKRAERAIAMDVRPGPLERAREHVERYGCGDRIALRLSDGLEALNPGEADAILIAGMGGGTILHILGDGWEKARSAKELILQPQSEISRVRKFLLERGYRIEAEDMVEEDGKFYSMMRAVPAEGGEKRARKNLPEQEKLPEQENLPKRENLPEGENLSDREEVWSREELRFGKRLIEERHPVLERYLRREESRCRKLEQNLSGIPGTRSADRREAVLEELADVRLALKRFEKYPASGAADPASETVDLPVPRGEEDL